MLHVAKMHRGVGCMLKMAIKQCSCSFTCLSTKISLFNIMCYGFLAENFLADLALLFALEFARVLTFLSTAFTSSDNQ